MAIRGAMTALVLGALAVSACAVDVDDEELGMDAEEVTSGRCAGTRATKTARVKVMTMNLRHDANEWKRRFALIADEIDRLDPDIIGLQEIEIADDQADALNDLLERRGHARYHVYQKRKSGFIGYFTGEGVGIMSRWPIVEKRHEDLGKRRTAVFARVKHPAGGYIDVVNTHLEHGGGPEGDATRLDQAEQTVGLADRNDDCWPAVLTGDMNARPGSPPLEHMTASGFVDSYRRVHGADTPKTGNTAMIVLREGAFTQNPKSRIDFVLGRSAGRRTLRPVSSEVCFKNHDAKGFYPSDHLGVMTTYDVRL
jgi:beta-glucosidase